MQKTRHYSYRTGRLPKGCRLCVQGKKSVLFVTGICPMGCFYCPISDRKKGKDVVYINEWPTRNIKDMIKEIQLCSSKGVGITGGDPLAKLGRTTRLIKQFKKRFGASFHIHLYTPLALVDKARLGRLYDAGLDEIRFHPDIENSRDWGRIGLASSYDWDIGVEIPAIPGRVVQTKKLVRFLQGRVDFININELEVSDTNASRLIEKGFKTKDRLSYGVRDSEKAALKLMGYCDRLDIRAHYCTSRLKDAVQLRKRIKRRAANARKAYDLVTADGMLVRGAIYSRQDAGKLIKALKGRFGIPARLLGHDAKRRRILTSAAVIKSLSRELKAMHLKVAIVEEYPTHDCLNVATVFL